MATYAERPPDQETPRDGRLLWLTLLGWMLVAVPACARQPEVILHGSDGATIRVRVEVVSTPLSRAQGLMYRRELAADAGMLFIFPEDAVMHFWMKNTLIPLDMIFLDHDRRVVGIVERAQPLSTQPVGPDKASRYVLEVNGGFAAQHRVAEGATLEFVNVPEGAS